MTSEAKQSLLISPPEMPFKRPRIPITVSAHLLKPIWNQFHHRKMRAFFVRTSFWQLFSSDMYVVKAAKTYVCMKNLYV